MPTPSPPEDWIRERRWALGDQIRAARENAGLTQEGLAELAGMERQAVNRIEQGHASPRVDSLFRISRALDVPLAELVRWPAADPGD